MSHDHMAHMMNVSSGHPTHVNHASHESMDHSNMDESMMHSSMDHANMDHGSMNHESHLTAASEACGNMGMHGMSVCIIHRYRTLMLTIVYKNFIYRWSSMEDTVKTYYSNRGKSRRSVVS